jgi:hypothetical protein
MEERKITIIPHEGGATTQMKSEISEKIGLPSLQYVFDHSNARFTANPKPPFQAQTVNVRSFRFIKE